MDVSHESGSVGRHDLGQIYFIPVSVSSFINFICPRDVVIDVNAGYSSALVCCKRYWSHNFTSDICPFRWGFVICIGTVFTRRGMLVSCLLLSVPKFCNQNGQQSCYKSLEVTYTWEYHCHAHDSSFLPLFIFVQFWEIKCYTDTSYVCREMVHGMGAA